MILSIVITLICSAAIATPAKSAIQYRDAYVAKLQHASGEARISLENPKVRRGDKLVIDLWYTHTGAQQKLFNPFFSSQYPLPAAVAVFNSDKKFVGDHLYVAMRSWKGAKESSRATMLNDSYVGARASVRAGHVQGDGAPPGGRLPPGKYYLQAIYFQGFVTFDKEAHADMTLDEAMHFYDSFDRTELMRSNIVELKITE